MSKFISNISPDTVCYKYGRILVIEHEMSRKGYDLPRTKNEITETEKEFDKLSIVKPGQTLTSWAINMRIPLQELWAKKKKLNVYHRFCLFAGSGEEKDETERDERDVFYLIPPNFDEEETALRTSSNTPS
ncbi:23119_t:CDS:2 [Rhizophagus irregularis]|nr:23119_t:CDS:2 [Rhizophagus irregularis]